MGYFKNLWSALIGTSNKKAIKKSKYAPAIKKVNESWNTINMNDMFADYNREKYTYNEFLQKLNINNKKLTNIQVAHLTKYGVHLLDVSAKGKRDVKVYADKHIDIIKNTNSYKKFINKGTTNE
jgi:hypothetical protein